MAGEQAKGSKKNRKYGRCARKNSKVQYKLRNQRRANKSRRILRSNGIEALNHYSATVHHAKGEIKNFPRVKRGKTATNGSEKARVVSYLAPPNVAWKVNGIRLVERSKAG